MARDGRAGSTELQRRAAQQVLTVARCRGRPAVRAGPAAVTETGWRVGHCQAEWWEAVWLVLLDAVTLSRLPIIWRLSQILMDSVISVWIRSLSVWLLTN